MIGLEKNVVWKQKNFISLFVNIFVFREVRLCWNAGVGKFQVYCLTYLRHLPYLFCYCERFKEAWTSTHRSKSESVGDNVRINFWVF